MALAAGMMHNKSPKYKALTIPILKGLALIIN
jgi:hypothetical protein